MFATAAPTKCRSYLRKKEVGRKEGAGWESRWITILLSKCDSQRNCQTHFRCFHSFSHKPLRFVGEVTSFTGQESGTEVRLGPEIEMKFSYLHFFLSTQRCIFSVLVVANSSVTRSLKLEDIRLASPALTHSFHPVIHLETGSLFM